MCCILKTLRSCCNNAFNSRSIAFNITVVFVEVFIGYVFLLLVGTMLTLCHSGCVSVKNFQNRPALFFLSGTTVGMRQKPGDSMFIGAVDVYRKTFTLSSQYKKARLRYTGRA